MAKTTLTVTVNGGAAPIPISVTLSKDGVQEQELSYPHSFSHDFDGLVAGSDYDLHINGINPAGGGTTTCELTTDQITLNPPDNTPVTKSGNAFAVEFHLSV